MADTRALTFGVEELNALRIVRAPEIRDHQARNLPFLDCCKEIHGDGSPSKDGGQKWLQGIEIDDHSVPTQLSTGYEAINLSTIAVDRQFVFSPGHATMPVLISVVEENTYNGSDAIYDQADKRMKNVINAFMRRWHLQMLTGAQAGLTGWSTLNGIDVGTGYLEEAAYGSQANTVGGLSKSTLSAVPGMNNQSYNLGGAVGSNGRAGFFDQMNRIKEFSEEGKYAILATQNGASFAQRIMAPFMRYASTGGGDDKVEMLSPKTYVNGFQMRQTSHLPTTGTNTTALPMSYLLLNMDDIYPVWLRAQTDGYFGTTDWVQHSGDYRVKVMYVECNGQLWVEAFHTSSVLYNGEAF